MRHINWNPILHELESDIHCFFFSFFLSSIIHDDDDDDDLFMRTTSSIGCMIMRDLFVMNGLLVDRSIVIGFFFFVSR